jgi:hypothetical protein
MKEVLCTMNTCLEVVMCWVFLILISAVAPPRPFSSASVSCSIFFNLQHNYSDETKVFFSDFPENSCGTYFIV